MIPIARIFLVAAIATGVAACSDSSKSSTGSSSGSSAADAEPWTRPFLIGNFEINTAKVLTHEDGKSADLLSDYVRADDLPSASFEVFSVNFYLPSSEAAEPTVSAARVTVGRTDASRTPDIYQRHELVETIDEDGERFTIFRVTGFTVADPPISAADFANVSFEIDYAYGSKKSGTKEGEVYKR